MSDTLCFNDRAWTVDELASLAGPLHIRDGLYLLGYAHHPLPAGLAHRDTRTVAR